MNCDRCPHMARIKAALAPCQSCEAGKLHHELHYRTAETFETGVLRHARNTDGGDGAAVDIPQSTEEACLHVIRTLVDLAPLDLLMVRHLANGGNLASFADELRKLSERIAGYHGSPRAMAHRRKELMIQRHPWLRKVVSDMVGGRTSPAGGLGTPPAPARP